jgi:predicted TIM-barrel fold metal-dependent hydrolase
VFHPQLPELTDLAQAFPSTAIVCDHLGGPLGIGPFAGRREEALAEWRASIIGLAACPNVAMKVGGIGMKLFGIDWTERSDRPPTSEELAGVWEEPIRHCIDAFGPSRCMFESNFPVDNESIGYVGLWNTFKRIAAAAGYDRTACEQLFEGRARAFYRI